jgi:hypothetical protein
MKPNDLAIGTDRGPAGCKAVFVSFASLGSRAGLRANTFSGVDLFILSSQRLADHPHRGRHLPAPFDRGGRS